MNSSTEFVKEEIRNRVIDKFTASEFVELMGFSIEDVLDAFAYEVGNSYPEIEQLLEDN